MSWQFLVWSLFVLPDVLPWFLLMSYIIRRSQLAVYGLYGTISHRLLVTFSTIVIACTLILSLSSNSCSLSSRLLNSSWNSIFFILFVSYCVWWRRLHLLFFSSSAFSLMRLKSIMCLLPMVILLMTVSLSGESRLYILQPPISWSRLQTNLGKS